MSVSSRRPVRRLAGGLTAGLAASALVVLSAGPGAAATVVAQATATALEVSLAGQAQGSGTYAVNNDGTGETSSGTNEPAGTIPFPGASVGTLAQDAKTQIVRRNGRSAACSGLAGDGATLVAVGSGACLTPGNQLELSSGTLDLEALLDGGLPTPGTPIPGLPTLPTIPGVPAADVAAQVQAAIEAAFAALGDPSLTLDLGAIQSACIASAPSNAQGDSLLTDVSLDARFAGQDFTLIDFPTSTPPNTAIPTQADVLVTAINNAIRTQLTTGLQGALAGATGLNDLITQINDAVIAQVAPQLQPLQDNLLSGTINKQETSPGAIEVTALDLQVLPAAQQFAGFSLASAAIGNVTCGPSGRVAPPATTPPSDTPAPAVPTFVPAGEAGTAAARTDDNGMDGAIAMGALGALALVSGGVGVAAYRRATR